MSFAVQIFYIGLFLMFNFLHCYNVDRFGRCNNLFLVNCYLKLLVFMFKKLPEKEQYIYYLQHPLAEIIVKVIFFWKGRDFKLT